MVSFRKENVLHLWNRLLELLLERRARLELSMAVQRVFHDMINVLDMCDDVKSKLLSEDYGKHLMDVEDLLQKHALVESDLNIISDQIQTVNKQAEKFTLDEGPDGSGTNLLCVTAIGLSHGSIGVRFQFGMNQSYVFELAKTFRIFYLFYNLTNLIFVSMEFIIYIYTYI